MFSVVEVVQNSELQQAVQRLWRAHSDTLGYMPDGGFEDAARRRELLAALGADNVLVGYVLFRITGKRYVVVVHLCVAPAARGQGIAKVLIGAVRERAVGCHDLRLRCRRDFSCNALWPKLGFLPVGEESGKATGSVLTIWRIELSPLPLLDAIEKNSSNSIVPVAIDANVFFDLDPNETGTESRGLIADWMQEFVELCVTGEILNEIDRCEDAEERARQRARAGRFRQLSRDTDVEAAAVSVIKTLLPQNNRPSTVSDARQLAMAIAGGVTFFVTRDAGLAEIADAVESRFGLQIVSPHEVVLRFDELDRAEAYRPRRLFLGPGVQSAVARADDFERVVDFFHRGQHLNEPRRQTAARLKEMLALPSRFAVSLVERSAELVAAYVVDSEDPYVLRIPYFAVSPTSLGRTAAHHYAEHLIILAAKGGRRLLIVSAAVGVENALREAGFWQEEGLGWIKLALPLVSDAAGVANEIEQLATACSTATLFAARIASELRTLPTSAPGLPRPRMDLVALERALSPTKISGTGLPCFLVPIQPRWAKELFDRDLAQGTLFGANPQLVLNSENVYYRAARPAVLTAPARVLWYVSQDRAFPGSMAVRACSYVDEVIVGRAKDLFRRFHRLGIYEWPDIRHLTQEDPYAEIMAFRFSKTELFPKPVSWDKTQELLERHTGCRSQIQSPVTISETCFLDIYRTGVGAAHAA